ncbi:MAG TPA: phage holin family protein [Pirellulales bacterium]|jgi:hypothetical protein|nr:phage holin family protein [Pirellulales bacterium]
MDRYSQTVDEPHTNHREPSLTSLLSGIVSDFSELLEQQFSLLRQEIRANVSRAIQSVLYLAAGAAIAILSSVAFIFALGFGLNAAFPSFPLWASFTCVFGLLAIAAGGCILVAVKKFQSVHAFPIESAQAFKENIQCMTPTTKP